MKKRLFFEKLYGPVATNFADLSTTTFNVSKPRIDHQKCKLCGACQNYCPPNIIAIENNRFERTKLVTINLGYCKGCGICAKVCPNNCITMGE